MYGQDEYHFISPKLTKDKFSRPIQTYIFIYTCTVCIPIGSGRKGNRVKVHDLFQYDFLLGGYDDSPQDPSIFFLAAQPLFFPFSDPV